MNRAKSVVNRKQHFLSDRKGECHMGIDLSGGPSLASGAWRYCLRMAVAHGWEPEGTLPPDYWRADEEWSGEYLSNGGQTVTDSDARSLAAALDRAVASMRKIGLGNDGDCCALAEVADRARLGGFGIW
jgi:hypothetical protein